MEILQNFVAFSEYMDFTKKPNWLELFGLSNGVRFFIHKYYSWLIINEAFNFLIISQKRFASFLLLKLEGFFIGWRLVQIFIPGWQEVIIYVCDNISRFNIRLSDGVIIPLVFSVSNDEQNKDDDK